MNPIRRLDEPSARLVAEKIAQLSSEAGVLELSELLGRFPDDARLLFLRGSLHADLKDYEAAADDFRQSVEKDPSLAIARFQYGLLLYCLERQQTALEVWEPLETLDEGDCLLLFKRGLCSLIQGDVDRGVEALEAGQRANSMFAPLNADIALIIGRVRAQTDESETPADAQFLLGTYRKGLN